MIKNSEPCLYLNALDQFLNPLRDTNFYKECWWAYTDIQRFEHYLNTIKPYSPIENKSILDLGAGSGGLLLKCQEYQPAFLVGVEVDQNLYELAKLRCAHTGIQLLLTEGREVPLPSAHFDIIFSIHVIEHVQDTKLYLSEIYRLLKPGGIVLLACPNRLWPIEPHGHIPFVTYLPIHYSKKICHKLSKSDRFSVEVRRQFDTSTLFETYFSYFSLKKGATTTGFRILEFNHPLKFAVYSPPFFAALGKEYPLLERVAKIIQLRILEHNLKPFIVSHPKSIFSKWAARLFNPELFTILQK